jgi:tetratricopeptide (TPR) repeat protein
MLYGVSTRASVFAVLFVLLSAGLTAMAQAVNDSPLVSFRDLASNSKTPPESTLPAPPTNLAASAPSAIEMNNLGVKYARENRTDDALKAFRRAVEIDPKIAAVYLNLSVAYDRLNRLNDALAAAEQAVELEPKNANAMTQLCELRLSTNKPREAAACYETLRDSFGMNETALYGYGTALMELKEFDKALSAFEESARLAPNFGPAHCGIGLIYYRKKKYKEAAAAFRRGLEIDPDNPTVRYNLAMAELGNRNKPAALSQYGFLKESNPDLAARLYRVLFANKVLFVESR